MVTYLTPTATRFRMPALRNPHPWTGMSAEGRCIGATKSGFAVPVVKAATTPDVRAWSPPV